MLSNRLMLRVFCTFNSFKVFYIFYGIISVVGIEKMADAKVVIFVISACAINLLVWGPIASLGVFTGHFKNHFNLSNAQASVALSLAMTMVNLAGKGSSR